MGTTKLFGPPGCGKTHELLRIMEGALERGVRPERVGFVSFSTAAANEAKARARAKFGFSSEQLCHFRTIHSLAFRQLNLDRNRVMSFRHWDELGASIGMEFRGRSIAEDGNMYGMGEGDRIRFMEGVSRSRMVSLRDVYRATTDDEIPFERLELFAYTLREFKENNNLIDFADMLALFDESCVPPLDVLIVDEAQDLSRAQWRVVKFCIAKTPECYTAADDDQAVHVWAGADVDSILDLPGDVRILGQSYRVPRKVHNLAEQIVRRIKRRQAKAWKPKAEEGTVTWHTATDSVDMSKGQWLLLARNGYQLRPLEQMCLEHGYPFRSVGQSPLDDPHLRAVFAWESLRKGKRVGREELPTLLKSLSHTQMPREARQRLRDVPEVTMADLLTAGLRCKDTPHWYTALDAIPHSLVTFYRSARKKKETLIGEPRIRISTIHAAKGGEADNVLLLTDVSQRTALGMETDPDAEHRVFYVGITRTKCNLHLIEPSTKFYYEV